MSKKQTLIKITKEAFANAFIETVINLDVDEKDAIEVLNEHPFFNKNDIIKTAAEKIQINETLKDNNIDFEMIKEGENNKLRNLIKMLKG